MLKGFVNVSFPIGKMLLATEGARELTIRPPRIPDREKGLQSDLNFPDR
jgi:hypothetical protein